MKLGVVERGPQKTSIPQFSAAEVDFSIFDKFLKTEETRNWNNNSAEKSTSAAQNSVFLRFSWHTASESQISNRLQS